MSQTTAKLTKQGKHFEILVDLEEALKIKRGEGSINVAVLTNSIFYNIKSGDVCSSNDLIKFFGSEDILVVAERIIKMGELNLPNEFLKKEQDQKYKQVVEFLVRNCVSPEGRPYTPDRIKKALEEARVNVKNKPIDSQISEIIDALKVVLPLKIEIKKIQVTIPAIHVGKAYGVISEFKQKEDWLSNGDLVAELSMPSGMLMDFYDKLNGVTHGSALSEELKK